MTYSVLIVEDQGIASAGVRFTLDTNPLFEILPDVNTCKKARAFLASATPDIIVLDVFLPDGSGLELLSEIQKAETISPKILVYSGQANPQEFAVAKNLGADGLLSKSDPPEELEKALLSLTNGNQYVSVTVKRMLALGSEAQLTAREQEVLQLLFQGLDNNDIAARLGIAAATIKKHRENIIKKMDSSNTVGAIRTGIRLGLIDVNAR